MVISYNFFSSISLWWLFGMSSSAIFAYLYVCELSIPMALVQNLFGIFGIHGRPSSATANHLPNYPYLQPIVLPVLLPKAILSSVDLTDDCKYRTHGQPVSLPGRLFFVYFKYKLFLSSSPITFTGFRLSNVPSSVFSAILHLSLQNEVKRL